MNIDWAEIWRDHDNWFCGEEERRRHTCSKCGTTHTDSPEWEEQQRNIENLINKRVTALLKQRRPT